MMITRHFIPCDVVTNYRCERRHMISSMVLSGRFQLRGPPGVAAGGRYSGWDGGRSASRRRELSLARSGERAVLCAQTGVGAVCCVESLLHVSASFS